MDKNTNKPLLKRTNDLIFKMLFADERNIDILEGFLKTVIDIPKHEYSHLTIVDPNLLPDIADGKLGIVDIKIHTKSGKIINVELQVESMSAMRERIVFYTSKMITEQIGKGEKYKTIQKVISIIITDFKLIKENEEYFNKYYLYDKRTGSQFSDVLEINILELPKIPNKPDNTELWNWLKFLKTESKEELNMLASKNETINKAYSFIEELSEDERVRLKYEAIEKARRDEQARLDGAIEQGIEQGIEQAKIQIALNLIKAGMLDKEVANNTGLMIEEIEKLKIEHKLSQ